VCANHARDDGGLTGQAAALNHHYQDHPGRQRPTYSSSAKPWMPDMPYERPARIAAAVASGGRCIRNGEISMSTSAS
jgi:hypothetical protein